MARPRPEPAHGAAPRLARPPDFGFVVGLGLDITDLRRAEAAEKTREQEWLGAAQKLEPLGRLARTFAHDLGDVLGVGVSQRRARPGRAGGARAASSRRSSARATRCLEMVRQLQDAARVEPPAEPRLGVTFSRAPRPFLPGR